MKVVLFCGGMGLRIRDYSEQIPKPMVNIGYRPILWNVMKYYAHYGHKDFLLCLGYRGDVIKEYFLKYNECLSNDFVLSAGATKLDLVTTDIHDWTITFADTGTHSNIGQRLLNVRKYLSGEEMFLANYSDGLTDLPLTEQVEDFMAQDAIGSFLAVKPNLSYHFIAVGNDGKVTGIEPVRDTAVLINGGYFIFRKEIFDYIREGEELVEQPFARLIREKRLIGYRHDGFWHSMDTFKDKQVLDDLQARGNAPWEIWKAPAKADVAAASETKVRAAKKATVGALSHHA
jgi:glucose-1-phosphate cytidylyltransferase